MKARTPLAVGLAIGAAGCFLYRAPINASESARWFLFSHFGAEKICPEMTKRGVALNPQQAVLGGPTGTIIGRFFPTQCNVAVHDDTHTIVASIGGDGYAFVPTARRVGFAATVAVEYAPDFRLEGDSMYVWGRYTKTVTPPSFQLTGVENPLVSLATMTPLGNVATVLANGMITSEVARGFTVVREDDGDSFAQGILSPPNKPPHPFKSKDDRAVIEGGTVQIHAQEREYLGPYEIADDDRALFVHLRVSGQAPTMVVVDKGTSDLWRQSYQQGKALAPPPSAPIQTGPVNAGEQTLTLPLKPGLYSIVLENGAAAPFSPLGLPVPATEAVTNLDFQIEVGEKP